MAQENIRGTFGIATRTGVTCEQVTSIAHGHTPGSLTRARIRKVQRLLSGESGKAIRRFSFS
ncbi:MAG: hypothetical protein H6868_07380 [Rhodospirillales bacterium]|nr:hypothetical protein [Rhodospirillales bacterium]